MRKKAIGEIAEVIMGQAPSGDSYNTIGEGLPLIAGAADLGDINPTCKKFTTKASKVSNAGDIIMCIRATIGDLNWADGKYALGRGVASIRTGNEVNSKYLWYWILANKDYFISLGRGATFLQISKKDITDAIIPLPPIEEQKRIAEVLDKADRLRQKDRLLLEKYDQLLQSVFLDMFGDPVKNEKGWIVRKVIEHCNCTVPGRDKPKTFTGNTPWVTTDDLVHLGFTSKSKKGLGLTNTEIEQVRARTIPKGSVLMTCVGDLGKISIADSDMVVNQQLHAFYCKEEVDNIFLMYSLSYQQDYMLKMASSTTLPYMNKSICNSIPIQVPPLSLQQEFSKVVIKVESQKEKLKKSNLHQEALFQSLLQRAFNGELKLKERKGPVELSII